MTTATLPAKIDLGESRETLLNLHMSLIYRAIEAGGTATQQDVNGLPTSPTTTAATALSYELMDDGPIEQTLARLFSATMNAPDATVAMHARSLVHLLVKSAAELNIAALENGEAVPVCFKEF